MARLKKDREIEKCSRKEKIERTKEREIDKNESERRYEAECRTQFKG